MLPPFIIEQIRKREEEERLRYEQPHLELPIVTPGNLPPRPVRERSRDEEEHGRRGVVILDI